MDYSKLVEAIKPSIALVSIKGTYPGYGTGFVFFQDNTMVTCNHVVLEPKAPIRVKFPDKDWLDAKVIMRDEEHDIAILRFEGTKKTPLKSGQDSDVKEGIPIIFAGFPLDQSDLTTHQGIISAIAKDQTGKETYVIDGTVNPGNSGCPLMTSKGEVIGIVNARNRQSTKLLDEVEDMPQGAIALHGIDMVRILNAIMNNLQLGIGYAVPSYYIPKPTKNKKVEGKSK